jgi:DNA-binding NtrC family response regulator/CHASE2 domain-containing sensor protein
MKNIQNLLDPNNILRLLVPAVGLILLFIFPSLRNSINESITSVNHFIAGSAEKDSNIVIIEIDDSDIRQLGGWPIKRSYYAILINYLSRYEPDKIGIEIFLSEKVSSSGIYDELLINQISNARNVILASQIESILETNGYLTDSISFPALKIKNPEIQTGHINYLTNEELQIPLEIKTPFGNEKSFSLMLSNNSAIDINELTVNLSHSWKEYPSYSLVEFLQLAEANDQSLSILEGKTIIVGVTDPTISRNLSSYFDSQLPGVGLHAIAIENINNGTYLLVAPVYISIILVLFALINLFSFKFFPKPIYEDLTILLVLLIISFILYSFFNIQVQFAILFLPLLFISIGDIVSQFLAQDRMLSESIDEKQILHKALKSKENVLIQLEKELDVAGDDNSAIEKINKLKSEITDLKNAQRDEEIDEQPVSKSEVSDFFGIIYKSPVMHKVVKTIQKVASQNATVLILGESGSGKELVANAIHQLSIRKSEPFVAVNCAALTESLLESELFGHVKGSFTNAVSDKKGMFEAADKGTIFLDEIGETNETFQVKLLRVLQSGEVQKVGATNTIYVDTRIVAATNKKLKELVAEKKFREDLYYRLNVITIELPPLRERKEDIVILANHFAQKEDSRLRISKAVHDQLEQIEWKGNVRELESIIKRAAIFAKSENRTIIKIGDLPEALTKIDKSNLENLILSSMREKQFSHTSINETGKELGGLSRIIVSENVRGIFFKHYFMNEFDFEKAVKSMVGYNDEQSVKKMTSKGNTYINNIKKDLEKVDTSDFNEIKVKFNSKYKNLPQKYHHYLDETIKHLLNN